MRLNIEYHSSNRKHTITATLDEVTIAFEDYNGFNTLFDLPEEALSAMRAKLSEFNRNFEDKEWDKIAKWALDDLAWAKKKAAEDWVEGLRQEREAENARYRMPDSFGRYRD